MLVTIATMDLKGDKKHSWTVFFFSCSRYSNRHRGLEAASLNTSTHKNTHRGNEYRSENKKFFAQPSIQKDFSRCD